MENAVARSSSKRLNQGPFILFTNSATPITSGRDGYTESNEMSISAGGNERGERARVLLLRVGYPGLTFQEPYPPPVFNHDKVVSQSPDFLYVLPSYELRLPPLTCSVKRKHPVLCTCVKSEGSTIVLIFDGEAEYVSSSEAGAVVNSTIEERMRVGILNVQDLTRGRHVTRNTLISRNTELLLRSQTCTETERERE